MADIQHHCNCGETLPAKTGATTSCTSCGRTYVFEPCFQLLPVECPWCGWTGEVFPPNKYKVPNYVCPGCQARPWHRLLHFYLQLETEVVTRPQRVLHFAPEPALRTFLQGLSHLHYVSTDLAQQDVDVLADICHLPFRHDQFDMIVINHVMEHIPDDRAAMRELFRILKPGGIAVLTFPYHSGQPTFEDATIVNREDRNKHFGQENHVRRIGNDYVERFRETGFLASAVPFRKSLPLGIARRYGLTGTSYIFHCEKPLTAP